MAIDSYADLQTANGGDTHIGRKLPRLLRTSGFDNVGYETAHNSPHLVIDKKVAIDDGLFFVGKTPLGTTTRTLRTGFYDALGTFNKTVR